MKKEFTFPYLEVVLMDSNEIVMDISLFKIIGEEDIDFTVADESKVGGGLVL